MYPPEVSVIIDQKKNHSNTNSRVEHLSPISFSDKLRLHEVHETGLYQEQRRRGGGIFDICDGQARKPPLPHNL
jgi:hypothetical protein